MRIELPGIHNSQFLVGELCRKRRAQRAENHFPWQAIRVAARYRPMDCAALAPDRTSDRSYARTACALLLPKFLARTGYFAAALRLVCSRALRRLIPTHSFVQQIWVYLRPEHSVGKIHLAH